MVLLGKMPRSAYMIGPIVEGVMKFQLSPHNINIWCTWSLIAELNSRCQASRSSANACACKALKSLHSI